MEKSQEKFPGAVKSDRGLGRKSAVLRAGSCLSVFLRRETGWADGESRCCA